MSLKHVTALVFSAFMYQGVHAEAIAPEVNDVDDYGRAIELNALDHEQLAAEYPYLEALVNGHDLDASDDMDLMRRGDRDRNRGRDRMRDGRRGDRWRRGGDRDRWRDRDWRRRRVVVPIPVTGYRVCYARNGRGVVFTAAGYAGPRRLQLSAIRACERRSAVPRTCRPLGCRRR